ncbi:MAG: hypothetical protein ACI4WR_09260, partial [Bulleidia sp.]
MLKKNQSDDLPHLYSEHASFAEVQYLICEVLNGIDQSACDHILQMMKWELPFEVSDCFAAIAGIELSVCRRHGWNYDAVMECFANHFRPDVLQVLRERNAHG